MKFGKFDLVCNNFLFNRNMPSPKITPIDEKVLVDAEKRQAEYDIIKKEFKAEMAKRPRMKNIGKWITTLSCGTLSMFTCFMCCGGCCGNIRGPDSACDVICENDYNSLANDEKKAVNILTWCGVSLLAIKCLPTLGCCFGCCGVFSPGEAAVAIGQSSKKNN